MGIRKPSRSPLSDLGLLQREINELFERLAAADRPERHDAGEWIPSVDVFESGGKLVILAEVPGLGLESLKVTCHDHQLVISGRRRERRPGGKTSAFLCMERGQGRFRRAIPIDIPVDVAGAEAQLSGGLLTVTLPRLKERRGQDTEIPVKREES